MGHREEEALASRDFGQSGLFKSPQAVPRAGSGSATPREISDRESSPTAGIVAKGSPGHPMGAGESTASTFTRVYQ